MKISRFRPLSSAFLALAGLTICTLSARAGDYYVDAANGSNANSGTFASPWRTISFAHASAPTGAIERIHIAPGLYDTALGESFPIIIHGFQSTRQFVAAAQGLGSVIVDAGGAGSAFMIISDHFYVAPGTLLEGLSIQNAVTGVIVSMVDRPNTPELRDLDVSACTTGISVVAGASNFTLDALLERVSVHDCSSGLSIGNSPPAAVRVTVLDSVIGNHATAGVSLGKGTQLVMRRSRIQHNGTHGLVSDDQGFANVNYTLEDCAITDNGGNGLELLRGLPWTGTAATVTRCTIAKNVGIGVNAGGPYNSAALQACLVFGNADDLAPNGGTSAAFCDIGDGDFAGSNGNFAADPLFVDAANGDYRLRFGSPCIESGDPATPVATLDLARNARPIDGDLDTLESFDIGAFEHAPVFLVTSGQLGTVLRLELFGASGGSTRVFFSRLAPIAPTMTPFGEFDLNPANIGVFVNSAVAPGPPVVFQRMIPNTPALLGRTYSFQALTLPAPAPHGFAYTNVVSVTFVP